MAARSAIFSECRQYRYRLERVFGVGPVVSFIGLNPSTADVVDDDPTIRRCLSYARAWGAGHLVMVNLFAYRATDPRMLLNARKSGLEVVGPDNRQHVSKAIEESWLSVAAWGCTATGSEEELLVLSRYSDRLHALKLNKDGSPAHPLYQRKDACPVQLNLMRQQASIGR